MAAPGPDQYDPYEIPLSPSPPRAVRSGPPPPLKKKTGVILKPKPKPKGKPRPWNAIAPDLTKYVEPETAWEAVKKTYDAARRRHPTATPTAPSLAPLLDLPARRPLQYKPGSTRRGDFNLPTGAAGANRNLRAALLQVSGPARGEGKECSRDSESRNLWDVCVGEEGAPCAGCVYNSQWKKCCRQYTYRCLAP